MKAALIVKHGDRENLIVGDYPKPEVGENEVVVKVVAVSLNHLDIFVRRGIPGRTLPLPHISGGDVSGLCKRLVQMLQM